MQEISLEIGQTLNLTLSGVACVLSLLPASSGRPSGRPPVPVDTAKNEHEFRSDVLRCFALHRKEVDSDSAALSRTVKTLKSAGSVNACWSNVHAVLRNAGAFRSHRGQK